METILEHSLPPSQTPIGRLLSRAGIITETDLNRALAIQAQSGGRLGKILVSHGMVSPQLLHRAIADYHHVAFINLLDTPPEAWLCDESRIHDYLALQIIPWRMEDGVTVLAAADIDFETVAWARRHYGSAFRIVITSPRDIAWSIEKRFGVALDQQSRFLLSELQPGCSAQHVMASWNKLPLWLALFALALVWAAYPAATVSVLFVLANVFYLATLLLKWVLFEKGKKPLPVLPVQTPAPASDLPIYTILIPLYKEAASLPGLLESLRTLDYPKSKLDIKLVMESDDRETYEAAKKLRPEGMFDIIRVPYSEPRTKPKACNYALRFARGEYVTIYDAEDRPHPQQLKQALKAFAAQPADVVCLQARLNYYNRDDNALTRLFAIEYAVWFDYMLPGMQRLGIPIPLGGTSNHIALARLQALGAWDPYNVTEDADLGVRIALTGGRTRVLDSITLEEAPNRFGNWLRQRSRWIKGYMQTWLVHMRSPVRLWRAFGPRGFFGFHLFIGGPCFVFLCAPLMWALSLLWAFGEVPQLAVNIPGWVFALAVLNLVFGLMLHLYLAGMVVQKRRWAGMIPAIILFPFYWLLHSLASFKALWQLLVRPHFWEKTAHGLSRSLHGSDKLIEEFQKLAPGQNR